MCQCNTQLAIWQPLSFYDFSNIKYLTSANCDASICDWNNVWAWHGGETCSGSAAPIYSTTCGTSFYLETCNYSDERLKHGIETLKNSIENIMKLEAVEYDWNENLNEYEYFKNQQKLHTIGLIAQNVRLYYPEVVRINSNGYYSIDYSKLNAVLVEGIKEQSIFIEEMDKDLDYIETKLS